MVQEHVIVEPSLSLDANADVLYARLGDMAIVDSHEAPSDGYVILNLGSDGSVVGVQVLFASDFAEHWAHHPDRHLLPETLIRAIDRWVEEWTAHR